MNWLFTNKRPSLSQELILNYTVEAGQYSLWLLFLK